MVTQPELPRQIANNYSSTVIYFDHILKQTGNNYNKQDTIWNMNINQPAKSMKGVVVLFEEPSNNFERDTEAFYNPKISKVEVIIEGKANQLYAQGLKAYQQWDEAKKFFAGSPGCKLQPQIGEVVKDLQLSDVTLGEFLTNKYALWVDLRTSDDDKLHGSGRKLENINDGITLQIS